MSISVSLGGLMTLSSYNKFENNIHRDAWIIGLANSATSVFAGFVVFAILGFMSQEYGYDLCEDLSPVERLQKTSGPGPELFFVTFPEVISKVSRQESKGDGKSGVAKACRGKFVLVRTLGAGGS